MTPSRDVVPAMTMSVAGFRTVAGDLSAFGQRVINAASAPARYQMPATSTGRNSCAMAHTELTARYQRNCLIGSGPCHGALLSDSPLHMDRRLSRRVKEFAGDIHPRPGRRR